MDKLGVMWLQQAKSIYQKELLGEVDMAVLRVDLDKT